MSHDNVGHQTALVTGASSGIGWELADVIAADGYDVVLVARREERLRERAAALEAEHDIEATVVAQDLAVPSAGEAVFEAVREADIQVHTLVNNAGVPLYGPFTGTEWDDERDMMSVNMTALTELTKLFVPPMVERGSGAVLNTASLASFYPIPNKAVYSATKSYVLSFSRALAHELDDEGITVTALCPGVVETEYAERGNVSESDTMAGVTNDPRSVAEAGWNGLLGGERVVFPSAFATYGAQLTRILPKKLVTELGEQTVEDGASWI